jgi:hypothetical protein
VTIDLAVPEALTTAPGPVTFADHLGLGGSIDEDVRDVTREMLLRETHPHISSLAPLNMAQPFDVDSPDSEGDEVTPSPALDDYVGPPAPTTSTDAQLPVDGANPMIAPPPGCVWMHVDTASTTFCSPYLEDLIAPVPTAIIMGTAATTGATAINALDHVHCPWIQMRPHNSPLFALRLQKRPATLSALFSLHVSSIPLLS